MVRNLRGFRLVQVDYPIRDDERDDDCDREDVIDREQTLVVGLDQRFVVAVHRVLVEQRDENQGREVGEDGLKVVVSAAAGEGRRRDDPRRTPARRPTPRKHPVALRCLPQLRGVDGPRGVARRGHGRRRRGHAEHSRASVRLRVGLDSADISAGFQKGEVPRVSLHELEPHRVAVAVPVAVDGHGLVDGHRGEGSVAGTCRRRLPRRVSSRHDLLLGLVSVIREQRVVERSFNLRPRHAGCGALAGEERVRLGAEDGHRDE
mmetsp:Transcript_9854/g.44888  ORF Transcript_9854/g.44888 Transcript_9854/m.44888 type:complete len:262 (+) Transcript_9854:2663-3448(+)